MHTNPVYPVPFTLNGSLRIGTAFGIPVRLHWTFLVLAYILLLQSAGGALLFAILFGCVFLHELGHSLVARHFGIRVVDITFWPLGGMARMSEMPEEPKIEGLVAIAGPAVNFGLAILGTLGAVGFGILRAWAPAELAWQFVWMNLMLGTFNLLPAFPMDGGRILRAWFARNRDWLTATELAVAVGRTTAGLMFLGSIALFVLSPSGFCALPLIALFVWFAGTRELIAVRMRHAQRVFEGSGFGPFGSTPAPPPRPFSSPPSAGGQRGFTEEDVRAWERFHGRLRRPPER